MDKKRLDYYKKKLQTRREELLKSIARTEEEGRTADDWRQFSQLWTSPTFATRGQES